MRNSLLTAMVGCVLLVGIRSTANGTTLEYRGAGTLSDGSQYGLIFDRDLNVTWLDYTNGAETWANQMLWAENLIVTFGGVAYTGWRLPNTVDGPVIWGYHGDPDRDGVYDYTQGYNLENSELGHLYYSELENIGRQNIDGALLTTDYGLNYTDRFVNLRSTTYWSSTELLSVNAPGFEPDHAWFLALNTGFQGQNFKDRTFSALAVLDGDVAVPIPEPTAILLFGTGIAGLAGSRFSRRK